MPHILDRPAWSALAAAHAALSDGGALARRYDPATVPFASARDDEPASLVALGALLRPGESMIVLQAPPIRIPPGLVVTLQAQGVQMVLEHAPQSAKDARIVRLGESDSAEMLALADLTKPGPFTLRAQALGEFWGIREGGRLIAMAGERMKPAGHTEVSGVCTHPEAQGRGLGRLLSVFMTHRVLMRGETPFLHAWASNARAIRLYESIGYRLRTMMNIAVLAREDEASDTAQPNPSAEGCFGSHP